MSVDKFKFVSPGVFIDEIDESGIPALPERMGPMVVGRFQKGPGNRPIKVESFKEFVQLFGNPAAGNASGDVFRTGELTAPTYAAYAVKAWLRNNTPCTVYRVLGEQRSDAASGGEAGWKTTNLFDSQDIASVGGAYGLFVMPNPDSFGGGTAATATLQAVSATVAQYDGGTLTLIDAAGTSKTYIFDDDDDGATGTLDGSDNVRIQINGKTTAGEVAAQIKAAIEHANGHNGTITIAVSTADAANDTLALSQVAGVGGNQTITRATVTADNIYTVSSAFAGGIGHSVTGTLAAVWYVNDGAVVLTGSDRDGTAVQGAGVLVKSDSGLKFTAKVVQDGAAESNVKKTATFNFDRDSDLFIRKVFNTNPTKANSTLYGSDDVLNYWLGETFESNLQANEQMKLAVTGSLTNASDDYLGVILALDGNLGDVDTDIVWADHRVAARAAQTGWFISQDTRGETTASFDPTAHTEKLFKFHALDSGEHANRDFKVSIVNIKVPTDNFNKYGSFGVQVRRASDSDQTPTILEQFSNCNLNPTSPNYIGRVVGDRFYTYDESNKRILEHGDNENRSQILRVEVSDAVQAGEAEGLNPFGVYGPSVFKTHEIVQTSTGGTLIAAGSGSSGNALPSASLIQAPVHGANRIISGTLAFTASIEAPTTGLRVSSSDGNLVLGSRAYFGYRSGIGTSKRFDQTNLDLLRGQPKNLDPTSVTATKQQYSWVFTLDDVEEASDDTSHARYVSGSRASGNSFTAKSGSGDSAGNPFVLSKGYDKFTSPMFGGHDGFDIQWSDPLANKKMEGSPTELNNSSYYSLKKAIDIVSDTDFLEYDLLTMPGVTQTSLTSQLVNVAEERADALAIIDVAGGYTPRHERSSTDSESESVGSVTTTVNNLKDLGLNSSYGCAFYPFVKIRDQLANSMLYVPPSVVALGTMSSSQRKSAVWFAPAGFTRGGLSEGSAGLPVVGVRQRLTSAERDKLYDANINPIASFPAEGIVVFGQKTLQVTQSALDRINVRRLMIFVKKEISRIASRILFDQNVQQTWDRFTGQVIPFLEGVQAGLGLTDFKVVLDDSTTTPDLIDRNILYAKIFLKPARAIEFIALDFIITRSGASFDD